MTDEHPSEILHKLLQSETVVDLPHMQTALGGVSPMTVFRYLRKICYRRSYNYNGRYYSLHLPARYDRFGLFSWGDTHFSVDGSLKKTVRRLVDEADAGATHRELRERLRVKVHHTLLDLVRNREVEREQLVQLYVYFHVDSAVRGQQLRRRRELIAGETLVSDEHALEVSDQVTIQVLLVLIRHPSAQPAEVVRYLRGHVPPIRFDQVKAVFARYDLGEKRGLSNS